EGRDPFIHPSRVFEMGPGLRRELLSFTHHPPNQRPRIASSNSATMLVILIIGLTAGPAVSLYGSPTVSPVTAALCASEPLPPWRPPSIAFLALSHAAPPEVIEIATKSPERIVPIKNPPTPCAPKSNPTTTTLNTERSAGATISRSAARVTISTA